MKASTKILLVEDNADAREAWSTLISSWGYRVDVAEDGERALQMIERSAPHILLLDLRLPKKDRLAVLREIRTNGWLLPTVVISGEGEIEDAVQSIKLGAYDYLRKPVDPHHLEVLLNNLRTHLNVSKENQILRRRLIEAGELGPMVGQSLAMRRIMALVDQVAPSSASVVIVGESGTGKELVARTIHDVSPRSSGPYIAIDCAALPETLMESELFGHERGAFTGADRRREGCFELQTAERFFWRIGEMKPELQAKLCAFSKNGKFAVWAAAPRSLSMCACWPRPIATLSCSFAKENSAKTSTTDSTSSLSSYRHCANAPRICRPWSSIFCDSSHRPRANRSWG